MFPMAKPAIVTLTIFNMIGKWNDYFLPLIFANTPEMRPDWCMAANNHQFYGRDR